MRNVQPLLTTRWCMKKRTRVRPEDFDVELLMAAAREGRLLIEEPEKEINRDEVVGQVRAYLERIRPWVTKTYATVIDLLWDDIFNCIELMAVMMPKPKARKCRDFDKYGVMRIIGVLREHGVYKHDVDCKYIAQLEQTDKDCSYRSYLGKGLERELLIKIR